MAILDDDQSGRMTVDKLQSVVLRLANASWCRYWIHWNYPSRSPWLMGIQLLDESGWPVKIPELAKKYGFRLDEENNSIRNVYVIERIDDNGQPFKTETI